MTRLVTDRNILDKFCIDFCSVVEKFAKYIIVSGFMVIASGRTRGTEDIDMIIEHLNREKFVELHKALLKKDFVCMQSDNGDEIYDLYLKDFLSVRYTYKDQPLPQMEIKLVKDALDEYQFKKRTKLQLTGLDVWFTSVNINIAFKEYLLKSDKDIEDAQHLRIVYSEIVDEKEIDKVKSMIKEFRL